MGNQSRYFIKFRVANHPGHFWYEYRVWDVEKKSLRMIMEDCIEQCRADAQHILKNKFKGDDIDILTFNLVEAITKVEL